MFKTSRLNKKKVIKPIDVPLTIITGILLLFGIMIFVSASLSVLPKSGDLFQRMIISQLVFALAGGIVGALLISRIPFRFWQKYALQLAILGLISTLLVWVPGLGMSHGGATRWVDLGSFTFQPAEVFKFLIVIYWAAFLSFFADKVKNWRFGILPFLVFVGLAGLVLLIQPDTGTFLVIATSLSLLYFVAGAPLKHIGIAVAIMLLGFFALAMARPYVWDRLQTFLNPNTDLSGSGYQVAQSKIAVGSGGMWGRGYGRGGQKFNYLPEPVGDSVFAVASEELGFAGAVFLVLLFVAFLFRGLVISMRAPNLFTRLLVLGIIVTIVVQAFINIASIIGLMPLTGLPLSFVSHGGTSLLVTLIMVGVVLQVSRYQKVDPSPNKTNNAIINLLKKAK